MFNFNFNFNININFNFNFNINLIKDRTKLYIFCSYYSKKVKILILGDKSIFINIFHF